MQINAAPDLIRDHPILDTILRSQLHLKINPLGLGALLLAVSLALTACATGPAYKPRGQGEVVGYTDQQLTPNRYRVTFSGAMGTRRDEVEDYLLRRAAEVTLQAGFAHFRFDTRSTEAMTYYHTTFDTWGPRFRPRFGPRPWYGPGFGSRPFYWSSWRYPVFGRGDVVSVMRCTAFAEIIMLTPEQGINDTRAISAREVLDRFVPETPAPRPSAIASFNQEKEDTRPRAAILMRIKGRRYHATVIIQVIRHR